LHRHTTVRLCFFYLGTFLKFFIPIYLLSVCNILKIIVFKKLCTMIEDKLLILKFKRSRDGALRMIYDKYKVELLKLAVMLTGDVNTAEDIVHDVFVRFAQSADRISLTGSLKNYLITSVINGIRNLHRDSMRHPETSLEGAELQPYSERTPHQWAVLSERLDMLSRAICELPFEQREVISLRMEMDMSFRKIATMQNTSVNTVKGRYRYAIEKLRSLLNSEVENELHR
jgi:RNA polymerase sigma-70 factor, ECF subfamily